MQFYQLDSSGYRQTLSTFRPHWCLRLWTDSAAQACFALFDPQSIQRFGVAQNSDHLEIIFDDLTSAAYLSELKQKLVSLQYVFLLQPADLAFDMPGLVVFDMDSTLIQMECIDELARRCGFFEQVSRITELAMKGELDFKQSLRQRVGLLNGLSTSVISELAGQLPMTDGVYELFDWLKEYQIITAVVSGGFNPFVQVLQKSLGINYAFANELEQKDNILTGDLVGEIVDGERKKILLQALRDKHRLSHSQVWAVGDGANDLPMMQEAAVGVAFHAKPAIKKLADAAIHVPDMQWLLRMLKSQNNPVME